MALFEVTDYDKKIYEEELKDFLPDKILDVHTHVWLDSLVDANDLEPEDNKRTVTWPSLVAKDNSIEDLQETYRLMFPGKDVKALMFTSNGGWDANNAYVAECSRTHGWPALYYSDPLESAESLENNIRKGGFLGVKSYLNRTPKYLPEAEIRIFDFFPKHHLAVLDRMGAIAMLHIPRHGRLKDPVNLHQMVEFKKEFPNVRLIIAHIGRAYTKNDVGNAFEFLKQVPDMMYDFCANCCEYAITELIRNVGPKHVMFGTDMPILRMRTHRIEENGTWCAQVDGVEFLEGHPEPHFNVLVRDIPEELADELVAVAKAGGATRIKKAPC